MLFRPILYVLTFAVCVAVFATARSRGLRQIVLLIASYGLYLSWGSWLWAVLVTSTMMNFLFGKWLRRKPSAAILTAGILLNLALLSVFKYLPAAAVSLPFPFLQRFSNLALPLGISFWTFQAMSYLFDLYREEDLDPTFVEFALYMSFFPVTISGPICRMPELLPQFRSEELVNWDAIGRGFRRIATGVLMMQLAKLLGQGILAGDGIVSGFDRVKSWSGPDVWCLAFGYGLQLFFDFAGYSHIAIGAAQALGFTIPENFARPFQSTTPSIFWTRWHMSLSFWIRDYVFLPLATMRREVWWRNLALIISMVAFGLWHKASVLFLLWGCYHGVLLVLHRLVQQFKGNFDREPPAAIWAPISWVVTMALINVGWIFFRANSPSQAQNMLGQLVTPASYSSHFVSGSLYLLIAGMAAAYAIVLIVSDGIDRYAPDRETTDSDAAAEVLEDSAVIAAPRPPSDAGIMALLARWRWYWLPPLYALALLFVLFVTLSRGVSTAQLMYGNF
ncbi:MAG: MBOAT family O-acyltransferase [Terriglobales bacterium]